MQELEVSIINWLYALENRDCVLLTAAAKFFCALLSEEELEMLFTLLNQFTDEADKEWIKEVFYFKN